MWCVHGVCVVFCVCVQGKTGRVHHFDTKCLLTRDSRHYCQDLLVFFGFFVIHTTTSAKVLSDKKLRASCLLMMAMLAPFRATDFAQTNETPRHHGFESDVTRRLAARHFGTLMNATRGHAACTPLRGSESWARGWRLEVGAQFFEQSLADGD